MCKLSLIVPVYQVAGYLPACMDSVMAQGLGEEEYEVILVDDGSDDGSELLCDRYAENYQQVRVIHQSNQGLSEARNTGLRACRGKWVMLVDSDDRLVEDTLRKVLEACEKKQVEAMCVGYIRKNGDKTIAKSTQYTDDKRIMSGQEWLNKQMDFYCYVWRWVVQREFIQANNLYFTPGISYEDVDWTPRMLLAAKKVGSWGEIVYEYHWREGSLTHPRTQAEAIAVVNKHIDALRRLQEKQAKGFKWVDSMSSCMVVAILTLVGKYCYKERQAVMDQIALIYSKPLSCQRSFAWQERLKVRMVGWSAEGYCWLRHIMSKI